MFSSERKPERMVKYKVSKIIYINNTTFFFISSFLKLFRESKIKNEHISLKSLFFDPNF